MLGFSNVIGTDLGDTWFKLLWKLDKDGRMNKIDNGSFGGGNTYRLEFDFVSGMIQYPTTRPLSPIMPEGLPPVTTDEDIQKYFLEYLMNGKLKSNEHYKYATWICGGQYTVPFFMDDEKTKYEDVPLTVPDQLEWCINHFKTKGLYNNHCYITIGYPESNLAYDIPFKTEDERRTSPCLRGIDMKIVNDDGKDYLLMHAYFRSQDLYAGWPENMGGITLLMEYVAGMLDIEVGPLYFSSKGLHCYSHSIELLKCRLGKNDATETI